MNCQELLRVVDVNTVFEYYLQLEFGNNILSVDAKKLSKYKDLFVTRYEDFISRQIVENTEGHLICIRYWSTFPEYDDGELLEEYEYTVSIVKPNENFNFYSLNFTPWNKILGTPVFELSLERYGMELVAAAILDEMFEFGMDEESKEKWEQELHQKLEEGMKDIEEGRSIPIEEIFKEFDMEDDYNSDEYKIRDAYTQKVIRENMDIQNEFVERYKESLC